jgi:hypothetical protein
MNKMSRDIAQTAVTVVALILLVFSFTEPAMARTDCGTMDNGDELWIEEDHVDRFLYEAKVYGADEDWEEGCMNCGNYLQDNYPFPRIWKCEGKMWGIYLSGCEFSIHGCRD